MSFYAFGTVPSHLMDNKASELEWHVDDHKPEFYKVFNLQADGDELEMIKARFDNVPITKGNFCRWRDEMAQFIYDNL